MMKIFYNITKRGEMLETKLFYPFQTMYSALIICTTFESLPNDDTCILDWTKFKKHLQNPNKMLLI